MTKITQRLREVSKIAHIRPFNAGNSVIADGPRAGVRPGAPPGRSALVRHGGGGRQVVANQGEARPVPPDLRFVRFPDGRKDLYIIPVVPRNGASVGPLRTPGIP